MGTSLTDLANPNCPYCGGNGMRNNGYFDYPCPCVRPSPLVSMSKFSPLSITEIQYLRGLVMADKLQNDYENEGEKALIDRRTTMHDFTEKILKTLDELES